ncbi:MAG: hypothetical protein ACRCTZ_18370 [Sarcina sp.]
MNQDELKKQLEETLYKETMRGYLLGAKTTASIVLNMLKEGKTKNQIEIVMKSMADGEIDKVVEKNIKK